MKAIILAAGLSTRLRPLTLTIPKPMIKVAGKPVLEHLVEHLNNFGINQIIVNLHYLPEVIMKYFGTRLLYSYEPKLLGEEGTIVSLTKWIDSDFCVIMNGDTLTNVNINDMFAMSNGKNIKFMDGQTYAGTRIISPYYWYKNDPSVQYQSKEAYWFDIGTQKGLERARNYFEKKAGTMSSMRN